MPPPPAERFVPIDNANQDQVVTDDRYPGLALTLPAGVTIVGWDGQVKTRVALERLDPDRLPVPPPHFVPRSLYQIFFGTPMGGLPSAPLPVTLPNDMDLSPGQKTELWYYDAAPFAGVPAGWRFAGLATVSEDGTRIVSDPGVGLERFCGVCGIITCFPERPNYNPDGDHDGEPVSLALGQQIVRKTDLVLPGRLPVVLDRTYNPFEQFGYAGFALPLGPGWALSVDVALIEFTASLRRLIIPGNARYDFVRQPDGTFVNLTHGRWAGAVITAEANGVHRLRLKDGTVWRFATGWQPHGAGNLTGLGLLISQTDRYGTALTISRDAFGAVTRISGPGGALDLVLDATGRRIAEVRDPIGRTVRYGYNAAGRLETVTDPAGGATTYTYNAFGGMPTITDPRGIPFVTHEYDANGRVARQLQADGGVWAFEYQFATTAAGGGSAAPAAPIMVADVSPVTASDAGRAIHVAQGGVTVPPPTPVFAMPTSVVVTNPRGFSTTYRLTPTGFTRERIDALGQSTRFERDAQGRLTAVTDPLGRVTRSEYDAAGNVTRVADPVGQVRTFTYEPTFQQVTSRTDPLGHVTRFEYDGQGNLTAIEDPTSARTTLSYDPLGQLVRITDPPGHPTAFDYDAAGNLTATTDPLGQVTQRAYDAAGRLTTQLDPLGRATGYAYDALNRLTEVTDAMGGLTRFGYDPNGNLLSVTDARSQTTAYTYDVMDRLATRTDPLRRQETYQYDGHGNLTQVTDRKGQVTTVTYDALSRRSETRYADGSSTSYTYDAGHRLTQLIDSEAGAITRTYDSLDRLTAEITPPGSVGYSYDAAGRRTGMTVAGPPPTAYAYDPADRVTGVSQGSQGVGLSYDPAGRRSRLTLPNGIAIESAYDAASRLTGLTYTRGASPLGTVTYTYDAAGNRTAVGGTWARTSLPAAIGAAAYDAANQQQVLGAAVMTYDANGNLASITDGTGATTFAWNARNQLVSLTGPGGTASFGYDALGRRGTKVVDGARTDMVHDGLTPVQEVSGAGVVADLLTGLGVDEYLTRTDGAGTHTFLPDALGSTLALADPAGTLTTEYTYEPFGATVFAGTASANRFEYTGRENDGTGLYYYRARYYQPGLSRFVSEDPIGFAGRDWNLYAYVRNNPVRYRDPRGLCSPDYEADCFPPPPGPPPGPGPMGGRKDPPPPCDNPPTPPSGPGPIPVVFGGGAGPDLPSCLRACERGIEAIENFCRSLPPHWKVPKAICWANRWSPVACKGACYAIFSD